MYCKKQRIPIYLKKTVLKTTSHAIFNTKKVDLVRTGKLHSRNSHWEVLFQKRLCKIHKTLKNILFKTLKIAGFSFLIKSQENWNCQKQPLEMFCKKILQNFTGKRLFVVSLISLEFQKSKTDSDTGTFQWNLRNF